MWQQEKVFSFLKIEFLKFLDTLRLHLERKLYYMHACIYFKSIAIKCIKLLTKLAIIIDITVECLYAENDSSYPKGYY